jgi:hypothetical protein
MINRIARAAWSALLLCGCAGNGQSAVATEVNPDCSFRSPTSCWTMSGRFPERQPAQPERAPKQVPVLASARDSGITTR